MEEHLSPHFLLFTYPAQGHINPALEFAKRLLAVEARVTLVTSVSARCRFNKTVIPNGLILEMFSDGYDDGFKPTDGDVNTYLSKFRQSSVDKLSEILENHRDVTCLVYTLLLPWAANVAREFHVPSAVLWIQPATVYNIYYYYFNGFKGVIDECEKDPSWSLKLPGLTFTLKPHDLPSFLHPSTPDIYSFAIHTIQEQLEVLNKIENPKILVNTFEALEIDALGSTDVAGLGLIPIGPLLPSAFLDEKDPTYNKSYGGSRNQGDYMKWLGSKETSSVIYVSFGSMSVLSKAQMEELGRALLLTRMPFLWVIREEPEEKDKVIISCTDELKEQGFIVPWCSQVEVLSHPSIGCFVTHCGWNSTLESITSGVPIVGFPQWTDQTTNAKLVEDLWKIGVRVRVKASDEDEEEKEKGLVKSEEIKRCLEVVMGSKEIKENAKKWRELALISAKEGGSSHTNLKAFIKQVSDQHT